MIDSILDHLHCPDCRATLDSSASGWHCVHCNSNFPERDLRPRQVTYTNLRVPVGGRTSPEDALQLVVTQPPRISYEGPSAVRDSRQFMSILVENFSVPATILDLGCGPRDQEVPIRHLGHNYLGVDWSSERASYLVDAHKLPFSDASFDCVFSYAVLEHLCSIDASAWSFVKITICQNTIMPVLKELSRQHGFKIIIPTNDHEPKHVHVFKGDDNYAKIEIETLKIVRSYLKTNELKKVIKMIEQNRDYLIYKWNEIVGE